MVSRHETEASMQRLKGSATSFVLLCNCDLHEPSYEGLLETLPNQTKFQAKNMCLCE